MRRPRQIRSILCLLVLVLSAIKTSAQYRFNSWTTDAGLPQNTVYDIRQTRDGYLWLTTFDGLVRFDGVRFTVFNRGNSPGISSNRFLRLYEDASGDLWAGTDDAGVVRYHDGHFTSYGKEQGLTSLYVIYETEDAAGHLIIYLTDGPAMRLVDGQFLSVDPASDPLLRPAARRESQSVPCYAFGGRIICMGYGPGWTLADGMPSVDQPGRDAIQDTHGALWIVVGDRRALVKVENGRVAKVYTEGEGLMGRPLLFVVGAHTSCVSKDGRGTFWITDLETMRSSSLGSDVPAVLHGGAVGYEDREGNIWFGTNRDGLFRARRQFINGYSAPEGLTQTNIYPIYQDSGGRIWVGSDGLFRYEGGAFTLDQTVTDSNVTALAEDREGRLIVGNEGKVWLREGGRLKLLTERKSGAFWTIYAERDGTLWLGWEHGLIRIKDGAQTDYTTALGLAGDDVKVIIGDGAGGLWIGSYGGLTHYLAGRFTSWTESDGLPSRRVRALYRDDDGVLWVGTYDGGMARFSDGKFTRYTTREGLFDNGVFQILEDGRGNFWMSSNRGIYRVRRQELEEFAEGRRATITSVAYGKSDGMLNVECNGGRWPAGIRTREGTLWFPTQGGVAVIDPAAVPTNPQPPPVHVESLLIDNAPVEFGREVAVQPDQENFEIRYTALSYINSENIRFRYRLEGLNRDWVEAGTRRTAYYSHVPPGRYTFRVIAANSDGVWNTAGASLAVVVYPPFWRTWWFLSLVGVSLIGLSLLGYRRHVTRLKRDKAAQVRFSRQLIQSQEAERKRIAAELHDGLGQNLLVIKNLALFGLANQDKQDHQDSERTQLGEISTTVSEALEEVRTIARNLRPYELDRLGLTLAVESIMSRVAGSSTIKFASQIDPIDNIFSHEGEINLYRIVQEAVNNVVKHSEATEVSITIKRDGSQVVITIRDNGKGFAPDTERGTVATWSRGTTQYESGSDLMRLRNLGFGLTGMIERVAMLNGKLSMQSSPGQGTTIRVELVAPDRSGEQHEDESEE